MLIGSDLCQVPTRDQLNVVAGATIIVCVAATCPQQPQHRAVIDAQSYRTHQNAVPDVVETCFDMTLDHEER
jgi:hypothetical protein